MHMGQSYGHDESNLFSLRRRHAAKRGVRRDKRDIGDVAKRVNLPGLVDRRVERMSWEAAADDFPKPVTPGFTASSVIWTSQPGAVPDRERVEAAFVVSVGKIGRDMLTRPLTRERYWLYMDYSILLDDQGACLQEDCSLDAMIGSAFYNDDRCDEELELARAALPPDLQDWLERRRSYTADENRDLWSRMTEIVAVWERTFAYVASNRATDLTRPN